MDETPATEAGGAVAGPFRRNRGGRKASKQHCQLCNTSMEAGMWSYRFVLQDALRVVEGFSVDGVSRLPKTVSFPKRPDVVDAAVSLTQVLYTFVGATRHDLVHDDAARTAIVFKLLAYVTKTGRVTAEAMRASIQDIAGIATILSERPELIAASVNFAGLLARHVQAQSERAARREAARRVEAPPPAVPRRGTRRIIRERAHDLARSEPPATIPSRPVIWQSADGKHCLHELIHPWHLVEETDALGHCIGRHPHDFCGDIRQLSYWRKIAGGRARIFSFAGQRGPLCTLHVQLPGHILVEAGPKLPRVLSGTEPYFAALAQSIGGLESHLRRPLSFDAGRSLRALRRSRGEWVAGEDEGSRRRGAGRLNS